MGVAGTTLPGGTYELTAEENARLCRALGAAPDPEGRAHPLFYYVATQVGMGISVADLLRLCDFDVADGPLMTGSDMTLTEELRVGQVYEVEGEIVSLERKPSRTFGAVDKLRFRVRLRDTAQRIVVDCTNEWVLPRREAKA